jgi:hypothetical protein
MNASIVQHLLLPAHEALKGKPTLVRHGVLVPPEDADALSLAIVAALDRVLDPDEARAWGRARSWSRVAEQVMEEICLAVGGRACSRPLDRLGATGRDKEPCR